MIYRQQIGKILKSERKQRKLSQSEAGKLIGVKHPVISRIETGQYTGSLKIFENYITAMGFYLSIQKEGPQMSDFDAISEMFDDK